MSAGQQIAAAITQLNTALNSALSVKSDNSVRPGGVIDARGLTGGTIDQSLNSWNFLGLGYIPVVHNPPARAGNLSR